MTALSWDDSFFDEAQSFEVWITAWAFGKDLWQASYGENGHIARILTERREAT
jgi:hypothetical protein